MKPLILRLRKVFGYALLSVSVLLGMLLLILYLYQDKIIQMMVQELNKYLQAQVEVAQIRLSAFEKFPQLALSFDQLKVHGSLPGRKEPLAVAERLYLTFDLWDLLGERYIIDKVYLENADVQVYLDEKGEENYNIFKKSEGGTSTTGKAVSFDLSQMLLHNVQVRYTDRSADQEYDVRAHEVAARLLVQGPDILIKAAGDLQSNHIRVGNEKYFVRKPLHINNELQYDQHQRRLMIQPSLVTVHHAAFEVMGLVHERPHTFVDLQIKGKDTDIQTILSLLPEQFSSQYASYRSKGEVYFNGTVTGPVGRRDVPQVAIKFGCRNASFFEDKLGKQITHVNVTGTYSNGKGRSRRTSSLLLRPVTGRLQGKPFSGSLSLQNFDKPYIKFDMKGDLDVASLIAFVPQNIIKKASGTLLADVQFEGNLSDLQSTTISRFVRTSGQLGLRNVSFILTDRPLTFYGLHGDFSFSRSDLVVNDFHGKAGHSDFRLNGWFKNVLPYLLLDGQDLKVEADFASQLLNFDELLAAYPAASGTSTDHNSYRFVVSPRLTLDLTCRVAYVKFRRFRARQVRGNISLQNAIARGQDIQLKAANGNMELHAAVDARQPEQMHVSCNARFNNIAIDSVFYMFENFDQTFIQDRHLRGTVQAHVQTRMVFNSQLAMDMVRLVADVQTKVSNGQLNHFEPMQKLSRFINQRELANLRFAEMENTIHIEKRTIFLPKMEISSNIANISVAGTHTFDQVMDYHLRIPLNTLFSKGRARSTFYGKGAATPGKSNLFLTVRGTSDNYRIGYDTQAVAEKIIADMKKEKRETREVFNAPLKSNRPSSVRQPSASEEYFDFE